MNQSSLANSLNVTFRMKKKKKMAKR